MACEFVAPRIMVLRILSLKDCFSVAIHSAPVGDEKSEDIEVDAGGKGETCVFARDCSPQGILTGMNTALLMRGAIVRA